MSNLFGVTLSAVLAVSALATPASADLQDIIQRGEIVVGVDMTTPPWGYLDEAQQPAGYGVALGEVLADSLGVELVIEQVTGPNRIPTLLAGRADVIISTLSITPPRAAQVWFTNPYSGNPLVLVGPESMDISTYEDIPDGTRIAVPRGSPQDQAVTANAPNADIMRFDDDAGPNQALISGQADLIGTGILVPPVLNEMNPGNNYEVKLELANLYMGMGVAPGQISLLQYLNTFIFLQDQNGTLERISQEYLQIPAGDLPTF